MKRKSIWFAAAAVTLLLFPGCPDPNSDLPKPVASWVDIDENGFTWIYTNDTANCGYDFFGFTRNINGTDTFAAEIKKVSGDSGYPYGMAFGVSNDGNSFYFVLLSIYGAYCAGRASDDGFVFFTGEAEAPWVEADCVRSGYGSLNTLKAVRAGSGYTVYINGRMAVQFTDSSISGSRLGWYVSVGSRLDEDFPETPVDVRFKQVSLGSEY